MSGLRVNTLSNLNASFIELELGLGYDNILNVKTTNVKG